MMLYQLGDALLRNSTRIPLGRDPVPSCKQVGPMLRGIRKASSNWLGKTIMAVVMGVLIVSFGVWGIADIFRGFGQSTLATVGHTEISTEQFRQLYTDRLQQIGRQFGRPLTMDQARAFGLDRQVLQQTIAEAALDEEARRLGLGQSDDETMRDDLQRSQFQGRQRRIRSRALRRPRSGSSASAKQRYVADQRQVSLRRQIAGTISAGLEPPKVMIEALSHFQNEQRSIEYVKLDAAQAGTIDPPSPETLAGYFDEHKAQFRAPEYRKIAFVVITPEEIGKWSEVSDEDARKLFEQRRDKLGTPEKREVSQIVFPNMEEAMAARSRIALRNVVRRSGQGARTQSVRRRPRHGHEIRDHRSRDRRRGLFAAVGRDQPAGAGQFRRRRWSRSARSSRASSRPMKASPPDLKKEIATERARKSGHRPARQDGRRARRRRQRDRGRTEAGAYRRHHRCGRPLRPSAQRPARRPTFPLVSMS